MKRGEKQENEIHVHDNDIDGCLLDG